MDNNLIKKILMGIGVIIVLIVIFKLVIKLLPIAIVIIAGYLVYKYFIKNRRLK